MERVRDGSLTQRSSQMRKLIVIKYTARIAFPSCDPGASHNTTRQNAITEPTAFVLCSAPLVCPLLRHYRWRILMAIFIGDPLKYLVPHDRGSTLSAVMGCGDIKGR